MTTQSIETSTAAADVRVVQGGYQAVAAGEMAGFAAMFHHDGTWNHRNDDRLGGRPGPLRRPVVGDPTAVTAFWA